MYTTDFNYIGCAFTESFHKIQKMILRSGKVIFENSFDFFDLPDDILVNIANRCCPGIRLTCKKLKSSFDITVDFLNIDDFSKVPIDIVSRFPNLKYITVYPRNPFQDEYDFSRILNSCLACHKVEILKLRALSC